jgi:putative ABC transport system permease protein
MAAIFSVEFLVLGLVAGTMGTLLANGFAALILKQLLEADYRFDLLPNLIAIIATPLIANAAGWLASWRILNQKPLEVLRHE